MNACSGDNFDLYSVTRVNITLRDRGTESEVGSEEKGGKRATHLPSGDEGIFCDGHGFGDRHFHLWVLPSLEGDLGSTSQDVRGPCRLGRDGEAEQQGGKAVAPSCQGAA